MGMFFIAAIVGVLIGLVSGLLGIGGGMIMVPVFRLAFGLPPLMSTGTSLFTIIPTSISGAVQHIRGKTCILKLGVLLGIGGAITSPLGVYLASISPAWLVMVATALVIAYSATTMFRKALKAPKESFFKRPKRGAEAAQATEAVDVAVLESEASASASDANSIVFDPAAIAKAIAIGLIAGVASGYVGLGGGFVMIPLMLALFDMPMRLASGTSLIAVMMLALPGTIAQCMLGNVDYVIGIATACGSIPGALIGARLVSRLSERALRFTFAGFLSIAAILLVVKELGVLG